jgi:hypothetical protein
VATLTRPIANSESEWREGGEISAGDRKLIRRELAKALAETSNPPSEEDLYEAFTNGTHVICNLRRQEQLNETDARQLLNSLTTLFVHAQVVRLTQNIIFGRGKHSPGPLLRWLEESSG